MALADPVGQPARPSWLGGIATLRLGRLCGRSVIVRMSGEVDVCVAECSVAMDMGPAAIARYRFGLAHFAGWLARLGPDACFRQRIQERRAVAVATFHLFDGPKLGPIGPSGEAAEDQHQRPVAPVVAQADVLAVRGGENEVGCGIADGGAWRGRADLAVEQAQKFAL